jgi:hypothetical protein
MGTIDNILNLLNKEIKNNKALCVLPSDNGNRDETSLLGTRDGILKFAYSLISTINKMDLNDLEYIKNIDANWDDDIKKVFLHLPTNDTLLIGMYIFKDHSLLLKGLKQLTNNDKEIINSIENDPVFQITNLE